MLEAGQYTVFENGSPTKINDLNELFAKLQEKTEATLRIEAALLNTNPTGPTRNAASMAQMELDRRAAVQAESLAKKTTWIAAIVGALAAIFGAIVGAVLTSQLGG